MNQNENRSSTKFFIHIFNACVTRLGFIIHGFVTVYLVVEKTGQKSEYWWIIVPLLFLCVEMMYTMIARKGAEYKYFWPSCLMYISTLIPCVWVLELDLYNDRVNERDQMEALGEATGTLAPPPTGGSNVIEAASGFAANLTKEQVTKVVAELGIIAGIVIGRWLLPRGEITRDQLSLLLLNYVATAADILDLFEAFEDEQVKYDKDIIMASMAVYSWSFMQFCLVTTATTGTHVTLAELERMRKLNKIQPEMDIHRKIIHRAKTARANGSIKERYIKMLQKRQQTGFDFNRGHGKIKGKKTENRYDPITTARNGKDANEHGIRDLVVHGDLYGIITGIFMMDGPFLILRLVLIIKYTVDSEMIIFFACKNALQLTLLVYRFCILMCRGEDEQEIDENNYRLNNVQLAVSTDAYTNTGALRIT